MARVRHKEQWLVAIPLGSYSFMVTQILVLICYTFHLLLISLQIMILLPMPAGCSNSCKLINETWWHYSQVG